MTSLHKERYGEWGGNPNGWPADMAYCAEEISDRDTMIPRQCSRKRGHGPEGAYCKQHDPAAVAERRKQADDKFAATMKRFRVESAAHRLRAALEQIANGHNDPRSLAREVLATLEKSHD